MYVVSDVVALVALPLWLLWLFYVAVQPISSLPPKTTTKRTTDQKWRTKTDQTHSAWSDLQVEVVIDLDPKQAEDFLLFRQQIHRASVPEVAPNAEGEVGERWPTPQKMGGLDRVGHGGPSGGPVRLRSRCLEVVGTCWMLWLVALQECSTAT